MFGPVLAAQTLCWATFLHFSTYFILCSLHSHLFLPKTSHPPALYLLGYMCTGTFSYNIENMGPLIKHKERRRTLRLINILSRLDLFGAEAYEKAMDVYFGTLLE
jgi:hypothetical protein